MTYEEFIQNIIKQRGQFGCGSEYHERHHIKPKCLGGEDILSNYIDLFANEHYEAHKLLALENPHNNKLQYAWWMMASMHSSNQDRIKISKEEYEKAKIAMAKAKSEELSGANSYWYGVHLNGEENGMYGKHHSDETKELIREKRLGTHHSEETKKKMSDKRKGSNHPQARSVVCVETGEIFWGAKEVQNKLGINRPHVVQCCRGQRNTAGGYHWKYFEN